MAKHVKMVLYGEPGVGKSTFAIGAPAPFFITTDGNYEYLEDFNGARPEDHIQCNSWSEVKAAFHRDFTGYETIVVDLLEDTYLWADAEFCRDNKLQHISDMGYGKGYGILGNDFFIEYQKLLALPKNIILIMHGVTEVLKNRRGMEYTKYGPSKLLRDKLITQIEGRVRFFVRAYAEMSEDENGRLITQRYLSLAPDGMTEYGIVRGLSENAPKTIPLDWASFMEVVDSSTPVVTKRVAPRPVAAPVASVGSFADSLVAEQEEPVVEKATVRRGRKPAAKKEDSVDDIRAKLLAVTSEGESKDEETAQEIPAPLDAPTGETAAEDTTNVVSKTMSTADKLAAIKAKMAALKG